MAREQKSNIKSEASIYYLSGPFQKKFVNPCSRAFCEKKKKAQFVLTAGFSQGPPVSHLESFSKVITSRIGKM